MEYLVISLYIFFLTFILFYAFTQLNLTISYIASKRKKEKHDFKKFSSDQEKPIVTVQLPVYNELYVIERLIDAVVNFNWPKDKLEVQVLDDSNDETVDIIANKVKSLQGQGYNIKHVIRPERVGFKAGALSYGLDRCEGKYVAIFDADFVPDVEFLNKTIPFFNDDNVGVVQTRWGHINRDYSMLTRLQAFALDAHFKVEQVGRNRGGHFINFNGTAGVWRKSCIEDAGGWQSDTLTEDLDLSYRAQLKGWKFQYLEEVVSPAELPITMNALKNQQYRWSKGAAECTRKNLGKVLIDSSLGFKTKWSATFHLLNSFLFLCIVSLVALSVPMMYVIEKFPQYDLLYGSLQIFLLSSFILAFMYFVANMDKGANTFLTSVKFIIFYPVFLALSMGIGFYNAIGVIEGYLGKKSAFVRTPKFNVNSKSGTAKSNKYNRTSVNPVVVIEGLIALYAIGGAMLAFQFENYHMLVFLVLIAFGFGYTSFFSVKHSFVGK